MQASVLKSKPLKCKAVGCSAASGSIWRASGFTGCAGGPPGPREADLDIISRSAGRSRLVAWGSTLLLGLAVVATLADYAIERQATAAIEHQDSVILLAEQVLSTMKDAETGQRGFLLTGEEAYLEPYRAALNRIEPELAAIRSELGDASDLLATLVRKRLASAATGITIYHDQGSNAALTAVRSGYGKALMDAVRLEVDARQRFATAAIRRARAEARLWTSVLRGVSILATILAFAAIALVAVQRRLVQQASNALLEGVLDNAPVGLGFLDADMRVRHMNKALAGMSERALAVETGASLWAALPEARDTLAPRLRQVIEGVRGVDDAEVRVDERGSKASREYQIGFYPLSAGRAGPADPAPGRGPGPLGRLAAWWSARLGGPSMSGAGMVVTDVTHRRRAERWLKESEERFRTLTQASSAMIWTTGPSGAFLANQAEWNRFTGQPAEAALGWGWLDAVHPDDRAETRTAWQRAVAERTSLALEQRLRRADGMWRHMAVSAAPLLDANNSIREWVGTHADITERKEVQLELAAAKEAAEAANRAKSVFLANMSHELRTPLSAVIGYSEMLEEEVSDLGEKNLLADLGKIKSNARHLLGLINDVLDLSKIEANRMDVYLEDVEVGALMNDVVATIDALVQQKGNRLVLDLGEAPLGALRTDAVKLRQCLFNLLSNAAKFTTEGTITLAGRREQRGGEPWLVFTVADTGIGMTPDQLQRLFGRFAQADESTTRRFGGTGLGLAISRAFARLLGGDISVDSTFGVGTTFTLSLPAEAPPVEEPEVPMQEEFPDVVAGREELVLVIDDEAAQRDLMTRFLTRLGFAVATAADGASGLEKVRQLRPRAVLLDVMMPQIDGWTVLSAIKSDPAIAMIPVIMVTFVDNHGLAASLGAEDHVDKPVDWDQLKAVVGRFHDGEGEVLIVDDDRSARERLRSVLERQGWTVQEAANGAEALARVQVACPRLILLDLTMPVMDGFAFLDALRSDPRSADVPVIVLSARDITAGERERLRQANLVFSKGEISLKEIAGEVQALDRQEHGPHHPA